MGARAAPGLNSAGPSNQPPTPPDSGGARTIGGVPVTSLAASFGTPLVVFDVALFDRKVMRLVSLCCRLGIDVSYAGKAFLVMALARRLVPTGIGLDVCSLGELVTAERAAFPAHRIVLHGCGKSDEELRAAAAGRVGRLVADNAEELLRLREIANECRPLDVLLRVNAGVAARTHAYVRTGGEDSKFGFAPREIPAAMAAVEANPGLRFAGLHSHLGSQIFDVAPYLANLNVLLDLANSVAPGASLRIVVGGGFGIDPRAAGVPRRTTRGAAEMRGGLPAVLEKLARSCARGARIRGMAPPRLGIEPGRALVAEAGTSLYRILVTKQHARRRFAIVDGSIADNPRPALYGAFHEPSLAGRTSSAPRRKTTICGRSCETDELAIAPLPADLRSGDLIAMAATGAYTYSMASNYNRFPRPAVAFVRDGVSRLVARRETVEDLLRNDVAEEP